VGAYLPQPLLNEEGREKRYLLNEEGRKNFTDLS
jgi:hypothetical protein